MKGPAVKAACVAFLAGTGLAATFLLARRKGLLWILRRKSNCKPKDKSCNAKSSIATASSSTAAVPSRDDLQPTNSADAAADAPSSSGGPTSPSGELALAPNDKSSSGRSDASTGSCASSASSGNTAAGSLSGTCLAAFRGDNAAACSATTADTIADAIAFPDNAKEAQMDTIERTKASCMGDEEAKAFVAQHGLRSCVPGRALGKGGAGHVDLVEVTLPDGTILKAARKTILLGPGRNGKAIMRSILYQELAGLTAAAGCEHAVQCLGYRLPTDDDETAELLLSFADGGSVEDLLRALTWAHRARIANAPEGRRRTGKNKDKYEMLPYPGNTLMDEADLKGMLRAMALFIKHLNARGYMHFDLKPANLLYDIAPDGSKVFRVCDFNLAVKTDSNGCVERAPGGSRGFWAWETYCQLMGLEQKHPITMAADVASMGLVLADAAGLHGLAGGTQAYLEYERDLPRRMPPALKELIEWMVAEDPAARPTPDQILAHPWLTEP
ncbi:hypothetical protein CHLRE_12g545750v5 [Chlamydomonas reinhardtii]|uniref:Protein kinase domain-containing protein n=1 Tax=Chlamydomonas reinhardtii TaxID=3055 RepID=A0A2K3D6J8_CHLRE|nr:uncharacterized protein CHLRE_12g545750v5 [Chlamydomonas reinhardtii]PNW76150.1 hypothetical protein CHLRE_12g545750v5 [Chlamydomonas reinhardtii]